MDIFQTPGIPDDPLRFNIAPTQPVLAVLKTPDSPDRVPAMLRWGLIPSWAKDRSIGNRTINARCETLAEKPAFRNAYRCRRCLVLSDGYYEWVGKGKTKQPYYIRLNGDRPFALAGLWERWQDPETDQPLDSCTIITTDANELTQPIHDRMPVILAAADLDRWLDPEEQDPSRLQPLLRPFPSDAMQADPVSTIVNSPRNDSPECIRIVRQLF